MATFYKSAAETGGDWHGFIQIVDYLYIFIGDVTGHGAPAAIITATVYGACQMLTSKIGKGEIVTTHAILDYLNDVVCTSGQGEYLMTFFALRIQLRTGEIEYANAGHPFPFHIQSENQSIKHLYAASSPLGHQESLQYESQCGKLSKGDILILYTDGLIENQNVEGDILSANKLHRLLKKSCAKNFKNINSTNLLNEIILAVDGDKELRIDDDLTIVCLRQTEDWPGNE